MILKKAISKSIISSYSSRKGNFEQRQMLNFNTYIKVNTKNQLTNVLVMKPLQWIDIYLLNLLISNKYIVKNNKVEMITKGDKQIGMFLYFKF